MAAAVTPYFYKSEEHPEGGLEEATIKAFQDGLKRDRIAFLIDFIHNFFSVGGRKDFISESYRLYNLEIAYSASPKGTLDCVAAFGRTDFRGDLARIDIPLLVIHGDSDTIVPLEVSGQLAHEASKIISRR